MSQQNKAVWKSLTGFDWYSFGHMGEHSQSIPPFACMSYPISDRSTTGRNLFGIVENVGKVAAAAVLAVVHGSHEDTSAALGLGALAAETLNLAITVDLVVLEDSELGLLPLVLDLLGGGVDLLLPLLGSTTQAEDQVESGLLLDVVVGEGAAIFELLASEDETLLVRGNALLVCALSDCAQKQAAKRTYPGSWTSHCRWCRKTQPQAVHCQHMNMAALSAQTYGDGLAREGLHENLHGGLDRNVVLNRQCRVEAGSARKVHYSKLVVALAVAGD
jgi:hypothetical protein